MKVLLAIAFLALGGLTTVKAQTVNLNCQFANLNGMYTCLLFRATVVDNENANIILGGVHQTDRANQHVQQVLILDSNVPFIITQLFTTFPSLRNLQVMSALTRIQSNAFANANNLWNVEILDNPTLQTIHANAFSGAHNIRELDLHRNGIETIHATAFAGLNVMQTLWLDNNHIRQLPWNVFISTTALQRVNLDNNQLESLDGRLFGNNTQIARLDFVSNRINAIQRTFLDRLPALNVLNMQGNLCADTLWTVAGATTIETIRQGLQTCFNNFVDAPDDEFKNFIMQLRGSMIVRYENGTEIVRI